MLEGTPTPGLREGTPAPGSPTPGSGRDQEGARGDTHSGIPDTRVRARPGVAAMLEGTPTPGLREGTPTPGSPTPGSGRDQE